MNISSSDLISDEDFNSLEWEKCDLSDLKSEFEGCQIAIIEPIVEGYRNSDISDPVIAGINIYLMRPNNSKIKIICFESRETETFEEDSFLISRAIYSPDA